VCVGGDDDDDNDDDNDDDDDGCVVLCGLLCVITDLTAGKKARGVDAAARAP